MTISGCFVVDERRPLPGGEPGELASQPRKDHVPVGRRFLHPFSQEVFSRHRVFVFQTQVLDRLKGPYLVGDQVLVVHPGHNREFHQEKVGQLLKTSLAWSWVVGLLLRLVKEGFHQAVKNLIRFVVRVIGLASA